MLLLLLLMQKMEGSREVKDPGGLAAAYTCNEARPHDARVSTRQRAAVKSLVGAARGLDRYLATPTAERRKTSGINHATKQLCCKAWHRWLLLCFCC